MKIDVPITLPASYQRLDLDVLKSAVWIYDVLNYRIHWANSAALKLWESNDLAELSARDFKPGSSDAVQQTLCSYLDEFKRGRVIDRWWQISPQNIDKRVHCRFSGVYTEPGHMSMLVEGLHSDLMQGGASEYGAVMICLFDKQGIIHSANPPFEQQFGFSIPSVQSMLSEQLDFERILISSSNTKNDAGHEILCKSKNGPRWHSVEIRQHRRDELNSSAHHNYSLTLIDIHNRKLAELKNAAAAETDALTGLFNRRGITQQLTHKVKEGCALFFIDLDEFKPINDSFGHGIGDEVLCNVARILRYQIHQSAICARLGGDEFIVAIPGLVDEVGLNEVANQLMHQITKPFVCSQHNRHHVSASLGSACIPQHADDIDSLLHKADAAMYLAKQRGRNRYIHYSDEVKDQLMRGEKIAQDFRTHLQQGSDFFEYQKIQRIVDDKVLIVEVSLNLPGALLPKLSAYEIHDALVKEGCLFEVESKLLALLAQEFQELKGFYGNEDVSLAINLSSSQLLSDGFLGRVKSVFQKNNVPFENVILGVDERALRRVLDSQPEFLRNASQQGFRFSLSEFGAGCAPLLGLQGLPLEYLKLASEFSQEIKTQGALIDFVVGLCKKLQIPCVAPSVDTQQLSDQWARHSVNLQQGQCFGPKVVLSECAGDHLFQ